MKIQLESGLLGDSVLNNEQNYSKLSDLDIRNHSFEGYSYTVMTIANANVATSHKLIYFDSSLRL